MTRSALCLLWLLAISPTSTDAAPPASTIERTPFTDAQLFRIFNRADCVTQATVQHAVQEKGSSEPLSVFVARLTFSDQKVIKGEKPNIDRFDLPPDLPVPTGLAPGQQILMASERQTGRARFRVTAFERADKRTLTIFDQATSVPFGWNWLDGAPISPWHLVGNAIHPSSPGDAGVIRCARTGRPAYLSHPDTRVLVDAVPPDKRLPRKNTRGDGRFRVTVQNTGNSPIVIESLRKRNGTVLWTDCLVVDYRGSAYCFPPSGEQLETDPVQLPAGESIQGTVNILGLPLFPWPFNAPTELGLRFGLGDSVGRARFFFHPTHHGALLKQRESLR